MKRRAPLEVIHLQGTPKVMGESFGEACRLQIQELYERRLENARVQARLYGGRDLQERDVLRAAAACRPFVRDAAPIAHEELEGIARACHLSSDAVWAMNQLTDLRDILAFAAPPDGEGCTAVLVGPSRAGVAPRGPTLAQTWDLASDNMPFVRSVHRAPREGPSTRAITLTGCLSLIGLNEEGLAIGTTNLRTWDSRSGLGYLDLIHEALQLRTAGAAAERITGARRAGGHFYAVLDRTSALAIECTALQHRIVPVEGEPWVETNHVLDAELRKVEVEGTPRASSEHRFARMRALVASGEVGSEHLRAYLSDREGEALAIERHDFHNISTNAAAVLQPAELEAVAVHGPPSLGTWAPL